MKQFLAIFLTVASLSVALAGCGNASEGDSFNKAKEISVVSREDGSGTRGAFTELFGLEQKDADGRKADLTTKEAIFISKTDIMLQNIESDTYAIGYVSMGSLNDKVKALSVGGVAPTVENVKNGSYAMARPFLIATKGEATGLAVDFIDFILSKEGQAVVAKSYIGVDENAPAFAGNLPEGKITVAGSSSVTPVMEKLREAYLLLNPRADIQIQQSDSTAGLTGCIDGACDIGMASRDLKDSESARLTGIEIALDGIAVIVNKNNPLGDISKDDVRRIYTGGATVWSDVIP